MNQLSAVDSVSSAREKIGTILHDHSSNLSYQFLDVLGYGTYGCIYLAKTLSSRPIPSHNQYKAIKCLSKKGLSLSQLQLQRQEINIHLSLSSPKNGYHPHIVDMSCLIETKSSLYLVMEYCPGGDLYDAITTQHSAQRDSAIDFPSRHLNVHSDTSVLDAMEQIISALTHSHERQVFHRDLKPENILIAFDGSLKLADFGLATTDRVSNDFGCGSSFYMAPEQQPTRTAAGRRPYSPAKSDIWSLGIIFLNLRFGRNPWKLSRTDVDATFAAYAQDSNVLHEMFPELSSKALYFLKRVLCVDPSERADCFEALELVRNIDSILGHNNSRDSATMEACNEERVDSDLTFDDSSVGSSRSSNSSCHDSDSDSDSDEDEADFDEEEEEEEEIDSMFQMEDDYGAAFRPKSNNSGRTRSCSSSWSMASSQHSGKSWSDMIEEDEMDFSLPVEFEESTPNTNQEKLSLFETNCSPSHSSNQDSSKNITILSNDSDDDQKITTTTAVTTTTTTTTAAAAAAAAATTTTTDYDPLYQQYKCYDSTFSHFRHNQLLSFQQQQQQQQQASPQSTVDENYEIDASWSSSSTWVNDDFCFDFSQAGFNKQQDLLSPSSHPNPSQAFSNIIHYGGFSFGNRLVSNLT